MGGWLVSTIQYKSCLVETGEGALRSPARKLGITAGHLALTRRPVTRGKSGQYRVLDIERAAEPWGALVVNKGSI